jgi:hypothetical protein
MSNIGESQLHLLESLPSLSPEESDRRRGHGVYGSRSHISNDVSLEERNDDLGLPGPPSLHGDDGLQDDPLDASGGDTMTCKICFEGEVTEVVIPCGRAVLCAECTEHIYQRRDPRCPICRQSYSGIYHLRLPA